MLARTPTADLARLRHYAVEAGDVDAVVRSPIARRRRATPC